VWICSNHSFGIHKFPGGPAGSEVVTVPLDGYAACTCDGYIESKRKMKSRADEMQITCTHIAQAFSGRCSYRVDYDRARCQMCGKHMLHFEDVIPVGPDRKTLLADLIQLRKDLNE
jgi:hypothetical protein